MKLASVRTVTVGAPPASNWLFVRVETDDGVRGWGEATLNGQEEAIEHHLGRLWPSLVDDDIESAIAQVAIRRQAGTDLALRIATSALDQALWDALARAIGEPLWFQLTPEARRAEAMGGPHVPLYANLNRALAHDRSPDAFGELAAAARRDGFRQVKCAPFDGVVPGDPDAVGSYEYRMGVERVRSVIAAFDDPKTVMVDCHWRFEAHQGLQVIDELADLGVGLVEAPAPEIQLLQLARSGVPVTGRGVDIAGGEFATSVHHLAQLAETRAVDVVTPDVKFCGGLSALQEVAAIAESADLRISPHNPSGPVANLATAHFVASLGHGQPALEFPYAECDWRNELVGGGERIRSGSLGPLAGPGLGVDLDADVARAHPAVEIRRTVQPGLMARGRFESPEDPLG